MKLPLITYVAGATAWASILALLYTVYKLYMVGLYI